MWAHAQQRWLSVLTQWVASQRTAVSCHGVKYSQVSNGPHVPHLITSRPTAQLQTFHIRCTRLVMYVVQHVLIYVCARNAAWLMHGTSIWLTMSMYSFCTSCPMHHSAAADDAFYVGVAGCATRYTRPETCHVAHCITACHVDASPPNVRSCCRQNMRLSGES